MTDAASSSESAPTADAGLQSSNPLPRWWWIVLGLIVVAVLVARVRLIDLPIERDEGEYAYGAQILIHGGRLYDDIHSMKWPGLYAAYALMFSIAGETVRAIHGGLLVLNLMTAGAVYLLARQFYSQAGACFATVSFLVLSVLPSMHGIVANAEHFAIFPPLLGLWCLSHSLREKQWFGLLIAGALLGLGPVMKQHAHAFVILGGILTLLLPYPQSSRGLLRNMGQAAIYSLGVILTWLVMCMAVWQRGDWNEFVIWTVIYPRDYTAQLSLVNAPANFLRGFLPILMVAWPLVLLALIGFWHAVRRGDWEQRVWVCVFLALSLLSLCPGYYFREHYFLMAVPVVAWLSGWGFLALSHHLEQRQPKGGVLLASAVCVAAVGLPLLMQGRLLYAMSPTQVCRSLFGQNPFVESPRIAEFLKERMSPEDRMVIFGSEPQLCFYSRRRLVSGDIYMYPLTEIHPLARPMQEEMIRKVTEGRPKYAVYVSTPTAWLLRDNSVPLVTDFMAEFLKEYRLVGLAKTVSFTESEYTFAEPGEVLRGMVTQMPEGMNYVAIFCRKDAL